MMRIERVWAMPNKYAFIIKPIAQLLKEEMEGENWVDPFAGMNSPAKLTNDFNPDSNATFHMDALEFLRTLPTGEYSGILLDPPYSPRQIKECYESVGLDTQSGVLTRSSFYSNIKREAGRVTRIGGKAICFGWNSMGLGLSRGFRMDRILLVPHGGAHNDTIVTVETRIT